MTSIDVDASGARPTPGGRQLFQVNPYRAPDRTTRPLGASCGDLLSQPMSHGGLALGTTGTGAVFLIAIAALVGYLTRADKRTYMTRPAR